MYNIVVVPSVTEIHVITFWKHLWLVYQIDIDKNIGVY